MSPPVRKYFRSEFKKHKATEAQDNTRTQSNRRNSTRFYFTDTAPVCAAPACCTSQSAMNVSRRSPTSLSRTQHTAPPSYAQALVHSVKKSQEEAPSGHMPINRVFVSVYKATDGSPHRPATPRRRTLFKPDTPVQPGIHTRGVNQHMRYANKLHNSSSIMFCCLSTRAKAQRLIVEYFQRHTKELAGYRYTARYLPPTVCASTFPPPCPSPRRVHPPPQGGNRHLAHEQ